MLNHMGTKTLETNRLFLRQHEMTDADDMYRNWVTDPEVCRFWSWEPHKSIDETKSLLKGWIENYVRPDNYHWIIVLKNISQAIGYIYFSDVDDTNNSLSVHFALSRRYWNQGIMTEACKCVINFAFDVLGAEKIHSRHHTDNPASGEVLEKSGMEHVEIMNANFFDCERLSGEYFCYEILSSNRNTINNQYKPK
jgi:Acetyltransferases, including N-acetylases of ribosomal proteins